VKIIDRVGGRFLDVTQGIVKVVEHLQFGFESGFVGFELGFGGVYGASEVVEGFRERWYCCGVFIDGFVIIAG